MIHRHYLKGCFFTVLSAIIFGSMPLLVKSVYAEGVNSLSLVFYRNILPLPVLYLLIRRTGLQIKPSRGDIKSILLLGLFGMVITPTLLFTSYLFISSGASTTLHFCYPVFVVLGCIIFLHERARRIQMLCVFLCTLGIFLFYTPGERGSLVGLLLAFTSGITYAFYIIYLARSNLRKFSTFQLNFLLSSFSAVLLLPMNLLIGGLRFPQSTKGWLLCLAFSLIITLAAVSLFQAGTFIVGPQHAAILSTFEPITSVIIGIMVLGEPFHWRLGIGLLLILTSVIVLTLADQKAIARSKQEQSANSNQAAPS